MCGCTLRLTKSDNDRGLNASQGIQSIMFSSIISVKSPLRRRSSRGNALRLVLFRACARVARSSDCGQSFLLAARGKGEAFDFLLAAVHNECTYQAPLGQPFWLVVSVINRLCAMPGDRPRYRDTLWPFIMDGILDPLHLSLYPWMSIAYPLSPLSTSDIPRDRSWRAGTYC